MSQQPAPDAALNTLHMIGNAHLDPVWLWRWPEGCAEAIATFWAAIDRLEESPEFVFTRGEAQLYDWVRRFEPALFERVKHFVQAGRWIAVGGWWVQPDCNLPNGESFLRQGLYGRAFFAKHLGVTDLPVGYNVDSFGHTASLPMLLRHSGFEHYVFMRPMPQALELPRLFDWVSPNGSSVSAYRIADTYHTSFSPLEEQLQNHLEMLAQSPLPLMCFYGVGDHGGGPTRENIARILEGQHQGQPLEFSHPARYFKAVADLPRPRLQIELQHHAIGCYSVVAELKRANRRAEASLAGAEAAAALLGHLRASRATSTAQATPDPDTTMPARFEHLWRTLLFNQFHDTLGGTCTPKAMREAIEQVTGVIAEADMILEEQSRLLAAQIAPRTKPSDVAFVVLNLTGSPFSGLLEYEPWLGWDAGTPRVLLDHQGHEVPFQDARPESHFMGIRRLVWHASIPAFGYQTYHFAAGTPTPPKTTLSVTPTTLENARYRLELDPVTGGIAALHDKHFGINIFPNGAQQALIVEDSTDTWSNDAVSYATSGQAFSLSQSDVLESGPVRAVVRTRADAGQSQIETTYLLPANPELPLEVRVRLRWNEQHKLLRLRYGRFSNATCRVEIPSGSLERQPDGRELPIQRWVRSSANGHDVLIASDALYSLAVTPDDLHFTAVRSPAFAHHQPGKTDHNPETEFTDQGEHRFRLQIQSGQNLRNAQAHQLAENLNQTPRVIPHTARGGTMPHAGRWLQTQVQGGVVTCLKPAENGNGLILRTLETEGSNGPLQIQTSEPIMLQPHGIHSYKLHPTGEVVLTDGLER
jgi:alpha-mannosidase